MIIIAAKVWLTRDQFMHFMQADNSTVSAAVNLWNLLTRRLSDELIDIGQAPLLIRDRNGQKEVEFNSLQQAMEHLDPNWIKGYGVRQHRHLEAWVRHLKLRN